jgi:phage terminase large subunit-like protein
MKTRDLIDVMESATGARRNPLHFQITTAGDNPVSPCGDQHDYACRILDGVLEDDPSTLSFFAFIAHADPEDDWQDERTWRKANPHYGISVLPEDIAKLAAKAKNMPSAAAEFKQKRLNLWVNATAPCLSVDGWRKGQSSWDEQDLAGQPCFVGVDLASSIDLCAMSLVFPPTPSWASWRVIQRIWTPEETLNDRAHRDRAPYRVWVEQGWLTAVKGSRIDHDLVRQAILDARKVYRIQQIGFDPWHADTPITNLVKVDGFSEEEAIAVPQTYAGMSAACLRVQAEILSANVDARGCATTAWCVANVVGQKDGKDNLMFVKSKSRGRIDPVVSFTVGVGLAMRRPTQAPRTRRPVKVWTPEGFKPALTPEAGAAHA